MPDRIPPALASSSQHSEETWDNSFPRHGSPLSSQGPRPGFLPDLDDSSMTQIFAYVDHYRQDLLWSFLSDSLFIVGGVCYVLLSIWDYTPWPDSDTNGNISNMKRAFDILAPLVYVLNAIVDIQWAREMKARTKAKKMMLYEWDTVWRIPSSVSPSSGAVSVHSLYSLSPHYEKSNASMSLSASLVQRLRKHTAHRRSILAAVTFGIAAGCGLAAELIPILEYPLNMSSNHVYILSAIVCISGKRTRPWLAVPASHTSALDPCCGAPVRAFLQGWLYSPEVLEDLGDLLFLIGSAIDSLMMDAGIENTRLDVFSAVLWLLDACLYLRSDFVMATRQQEDNSPLV